jgi:hypothetical protein
VRELINLAGLGLLGLGLAAWAATAGLDADGGGGPTPAEDAGAPVVVDAVPADAAVEDARALLLGREVVGVAAGPDGGFVLVFEGGASVSIEVVLPPRTDALEDRCSRSW